MDKELWIKEIETPAFKPLNQWREELYGYYMITSEEKIVDDIEMISVYYYGTDKEKLNNIWYELQSKVEDLSIVIPLNKRSNWLGGAFLVRD